VGFSSPKSISSFRFFTNSQIVALLPDGNLFWKSSVFNGACSGTPVIGEDGSFVYFTRNTIADGYFTILAADLDGIAYFDDHTQPRPFAPPGIYHNPAEGYYLGGAGNTNDLVIFASTGFYGEMGVDVGSLFAFQLPLLDAEPAVTLMNNASSWYSFSAPKITNSGYSMYMTSSRNQFRAWVGSVGDKTNQFHKLSTETVSFPRAIPAWLAPTASVALSNSPSKPMVFGGAATDIMVGYTFDMKEMWTVASSSSIQVAAKVSTQDDRVYWVEENGMVHSSNTASGIDFWAVQLSTAPVRSDFAQTSDGSTLFFTDVDGNMIAWSVAVVPTRTPTTAPTGIFSPSPSSVLTKAPTTRSLAPLPKASSGSTSPSAAPSSAAPSAAPSAGQSAAVTSDPTITAAPVSKAPTKLITPVPSAEPSSLPTSTPTVRTQAPTVLNTSTPTSGAAATMALSSFVFILLLLF
jgi:hypothetical protein